MKYDSLYETKVFNRVNETNLEYIGIVGLFDRYISASSMQIEEMKLILKNLFP